MKMVLGGPLRLIIEAPTCFSTGSFYLFICCFIFGCVGSAAARGLSLVVVGARATLQLCVWASHCSGFSCGARAPEDVGSIVSSRRFQREGSVVVAHGLSCPAARGIFPDQGSNPCTGLLGKPSTYSFNQVGSCQRMAQQVSPLFPQLEDPLCLSREACSGCYCVCFMMLVLASALSYLTIFCSPRCAAATLQLTLLLALASIRLCNPASTDSGCIVYRKFYEASRK